MHDSSVVHTIGNITLKLFNIKYTQMLSLKTEISFLAILHGTNNFIFSFLFINMKNYFQWQWNIHSSNCWGKKKLFNKMKNFSNWKWKILFVYFFIVSEIPHFILLTCTIVCNKRRRLKLYFVNNQSTHLSNKVFFKWCKLIKKWKQN